MNSAYARSAARAAAHPDRGAGATGLRALDHYAEISFLGLVDVASTRSAASPSPRTGGRAARREVRGRLDAGCQHMDGVQALQYARARYSDRGRPGPGHRAAAAAGRRHRRQALSAGAS
ncbi:hypothetical protein [Streptomyces sp. KL116D]|uniref:hypothetical protein n=1 Tax=Streptomyces sp. KL116D TaxID=3045152 RepID=UPI0035590DCD